MSIYTIGEIADRSGFSASALRYYEGIGLVVPAARTDAGYRVYDDHTLARLAFIDRAKQLGCSLEEITDLVGIWDGEQCGPVQRRFHDLISTKIVDARRQIAELTALMSQLQAAATQLSRPPVDGPCGDECACMSDPPAAWEPVALSLRVDPEAPVACSLDVAARPDRLDAWRAMLARACSRPTTTDGAARVEFDDDVAVDELARLVVAEQQCCAFLAFALTVDSRGLGLEVRAPDGTTDVLAWLFEPA